jgi:hypothetical protein
MRRLWLRACHLLRKGGARAAAAERPPAAALGEEEESLRTKKRFAALTALAASFVVGLIVAPAASAWSVTMTAQPSLKRTHHWTIEKSVSQEAVVLAPGQTTTVQYSVTVKSTGSTDSDFAVSGLMEMSEDPDITIGSVVFKILPEEILATHSCLPSSFPVELGIVGLQCSYSAALPDAGDRTAWMRAVVSDPVGFRNAFEPFSFANATVDEVDECVTVTDSLQGPLGPLCVGDAPKTFTYTRTIGPYWECGEHTVDNTAAFLTNDTGATGSADASVGVTVLCTSGCTRTIGYWKTHAGFGPQADVVTPLLPVWLGTAGGTTSLNVTTAAYAVQLLSFKGSNNVFKPSNGINKLYAQLLGAKLNIKNGGSAASIGGTIAAADAFLATHNSTSWGDLSEAEQETVLDWMTALDDYNNGLSDSTHCS